MILAAGRGKRMGALTDNCPKPLLMLGGETLIERQIKRLQIAGIKNIVINLGYLGEQIRAHLGDGSRYGVKLQYSLEPQSGLETGGGVFQALPLLGDAPFLLTNADVFCDYPYHTLRNKVPDSVHLVLVDNPDFKESGDFSLKNGYLQRGSSLTFAGISVVNPCIFQACQPGFFPIAPLFHQSIDNQTATAEYYRGKWSDIGTPQRLAQAEEMT